MADASAVTAVSGLRGDPLFSQVQAALNKVITDLAALRMRLDNSLVATTTATPALTSGTTTDGAVRLTNTITYAIAGTQYVKVASDDFWDLSSEDPTDDATYRAYGLLLSTEGTASFTSAEGTSSALAVQAVLLKHTDTSKAWIGTFVANPDTTFGDSALAAQGSFSQGFGALTDFQAYVCNWG